MNKYDVKAIILIFFILLVISGMAVFGISAYKRIIEQSNNNPEELFTGNVIITPDLNKNELVVKVEGNTIEGILPEGNQATKPSVSENNTKYYYEQLDSYSKIIYDKLKENKENMKSGTYKLDFGKAFNELLAKENGSDLLQQYYQSAIESYMYDNPEVFYLEPTKMYINIQTTKKIFTTTYEVYIDQGEGNNYFAEGYNSKEQILSCENKINEVTQEILNKVEGKSNYDKILTVHDYLVDNITYEETASKENIYNMYGALVNKEAVCEGYAKAFKYLMNKVGIETIVIIGKATDSNGDTQNHAWNYVNFNNTWYAVDATWDDPIIIGGGKLEQKHKYKYFLKGKTTMSENHIESYTFIENGKVYNHPDLSITDYK